MHPNNSISLRSLCFLLLVAFSLSSYASANADTTNLSQRLETVKVLLVQDQNDLALQTLLEMKAEIERSDKQEGAISLWVEFYIGDALEKDQKDEEALIKLLWVKEQSLERGLSEIYTEACIVLALLYEKLNMPEKCVENLKEAELQILEHQYDSIFPEYAIRNASYHRLYGQQDSAIYYAQRALETAHEIGLVEQTGISHLLLGMLNRSKCDKALFHFKRGSQYLLQTKHYTGYAYAILNTTKTNLACNRLKAALAYSDTSMVAIQYAEKMGNDFYTWASFYEARAEIFYKLQQYDSAWYNINIAADLRLEQERRSNAEKVKEIDEKYSDDKKAQKLAEQEQVIKLERQSRVFLTTLILLILIIFAILVYFYLRLRKVNHKTVQQSKVISKTNTDLVQSLDEQVILQSEVHHRVKNNLQIIISLMEIQKDEIQDPEIIARFEAMSNRIYSMSAIHEILYQDNRISKIDFLDYTERICTHLANLSPDGEPPKFDIQIVPVTFNLETSIPLGVILTELVTNSLKYAKIPGKELQISIELTPLNAGYSFQYKDNGPGFGAHGIQERKGGLGTYLLRSMTRQLKGTIEYKSANGANINIYFKERKKSMLSHTGSVKTTNI